MSITYPWQAQQWQRLRLAASQERLPHALLLSGMAGSGIRQFALAFAHYLLCAAPTAAGTACGQCRSCLLAKAGNHPDIRVLEAEDDSAQIKVEAVRELIAYLQLSSQYGGRKIAIIEPTEGMNRHAANSLLKTLEEPAASALLILISCQPARLLVTLRSRCQRVSFTDIDRQQALDWLQGQLAEPAPAEELLELAGGAPLTALELAGSDALAQWQELLQDLQHAAHPHTYPAEIAEKWVKQDAAEMLTRLLFLFNKMAVLHASGAKQPVVPSDLNGKLCQLTTQLRLSMLLDCHALTLQNYQLLSAGSNLNKQSLLEQIIVYWQSIHR